MKFYIFLGMFITAVHHCFIFLTSNKIMIRFLLKCCNKIFIFFSSAGTTNWTINITVFRHRGCLIFLKIGLCQLALKLKPKLSPLTFKFTQNKKETYVKPFKNGFIFERPAFGSEVVTNLKVAYYGNETSPNKRLT